jgi:hypothetical protein
VAALRAELAAIIGNGEEAWMRFGRTIAGYSWHFKSIL